MTGMSRVIIQSPKSFQPVVPAEAIKKPETEKTQIIDQNLNARGRTVIAEKALNKAINELAQRLSNNDLNVSKTLDSTGGIKTVSISDSSGKTIVEMPPKAALAIADRAKEKALGLMIDKAV